MNDDLLTIDEARQYLKVGRTKMYELVWAKAVPSVRIGKALRIKLVDLKQYIESKREVGPQA